MWNSEKTVEWSVGQSLVKERFVSHMGKLAARFSWEEKEVKKSACQSTW